MQKFFSQVKHHLIWVLFLLLGVTVTSVFGQSPIIKKSPYDDRHYATTTLNNGLKIIVVSDPHAQSASAAMMVDVGLYDDPLEFPGLAHFLEHMLFLGTKKFPATDEFQNLLKANGGNYNAFTQGARTTYFFTVQPQAFTDSLERFADFFVAPLFNQELVERELKAVDAEFKLRLNQDYSKIFEVGQETTNPDHPLSHLMGGNLVTLGQDQTKLYPALIQFYQQHYYAQKMSLALVGPQSTQELLNYAQRYFNEIVSHAVPSSASYPALFTSEQLGVDIFIKSQGDLRELSLTFPINPGHFHSTSNTGALLAQLIRDESKGSLVQFLKKKHWITAMQVAYEDPVDEAEALTLHFSLTPAGLDHIDEITQTFFSFITLLKTQGIPRHFYQETKKIYQWEFLYHDRQDPEDYALQLASNLRVLPEEKILSALYELPSYKEVVQQTHHLLAQITPQQMRRFIIHNQNETNRKTRWFAGDYRLAKISEQTLQQFMQAPLLAQLQLPPKNPYMAKQVKLRKFFHQSEKFPQRIDLPNVALWYHEDTTFKKPYGSILLNVASPLPLMTAKNALLSQMYITIAGEKLKEDLYAAAMAGISISVHDHNRGMTLGTSGYCENQTQVLLSALNHLKNFQINEQQFHAIKEKMLRDLNEYQQMALLGKGFQNLQVLLATPSWHPQELLVAAKEVTIENLTAYQQAFWQNLQLEMLVSGHFSKRTAKKIGLQVAEKLNSSQSVNAIPGVKVVKLAKEAPVIYPVATKDENQLVIWYLQNETRDLSTVGKTLLLAQLLEGPFYQQLRVEQQLGYALSTNAWINHQVSGLVFWIQSPTQAPKQLLQQIGLFLQNQREKIAHLSEEELASHRQALVSKILEDVRSQEERTQWWWSKIEQGDIEFDRHEKLATIIQNLTVQDLVAFSDQLLREKPTAGQIIVMSTPQEKSTLSAANNLAFLGKFKAQSAYFSEKTAEN